MPVIESKFTFFKMIIERLFLEPTEFGEPCFSIAPKAFNTINMCFSSNKFVLSMVHSKVFFVSQINQSIVTTPAIWMNNRFHIYSSPYDILERFPTSVRNNFSINLTMPVEYSKYNRFTACAFISAAGQNYLLNRWWTFTNQMSDSPISLQGYIRFMFIALRWVFYIQLY